MKEKGQRTSRAGMKTRGKRDKWSVPPLCVAKIEGGSLRCRYANCVLKPCVFPGKNDLFQLTNHSVPPLSVIGVRVDRPVKLFLTVGHDLRSIL